MGKKYRIIHYSKIRFVCILIPLWLSGFPLAMLLLPHGLIGEIFLGILAVVIVFSSFFILPKHIAKGLLIICVNKDGLCIDCLKPYWGRKPKQSQYIGWDELKSYKYEPSYNFSTLKLRLKSGKKIKLHRWYNDNDDDFDKFMTHFRRAVENYNKRKTTTTLIEKEKLIMENKVFLLTTAVIIALIFIAAVLLVIFKGISNAKGFIAIAIILGPLLWVIMQIIQGLGKNI